jgi:hypothetical protein
VQKRNGAEIKDAETLGGKFIFQHLSINNRIALLIAVLKTVGRTPRTAFDRPIFDISASS